MKKPASASASTERRFFVIIAGVDFRKEPEVKNRVIDFSYLDENPFANLEQESNVVRLDLQFEPPDHFHDMWNSLLNENQNESERLSALRAFEELMRRAGQNLEQKPQKESVFTFRCRKPAQSAVHLHGTLKRNTSAAQTWLTLYNQSLQALTKKSKQPFPQTSIREAAIFHTIDQILKQSFMT